MKIIDMPIGDVVPYKNNPRRNDAAVKPVTAEFASWDSLSAWESSLIMWRFNKSY